MLKTFAIENRSATAAWNNLVQGEKTKRNLNLNVNLNLPNKLIITELSV